LHATLRFLVAENYPQQKIRRFGDGTIFRMMAPGSHHQRRQSDGPDRGISSSSNTAHPDPAELHALFKLMGYVPVRGAATRTKKITVYRQGDINFLVNGRTRATHGFFGFCRRARETVCGPSMGGFLVGPMRKMGPWNARLSLGAERAGRDPNRTEKKTLDVPAI